LSALVEAVGGMNQFAIREVVELFIVCVTAYDLMPHKVMPSRFPNYKEAWSLKAVMV
jgi:hypothetical protein